jgi:hypothetical protein
MSTIVVEAPAQSERGLKRFHESVFLAGGITGCPDWQKDAIKLFEMGNADLIVYNPRRENFPIHDPTAAEAQINWEHYNLARSDAVMFWFPMDTLCPIVLYELGAWSMTDKPIFVGVHPKYQRRQDVFIQTKLARPEVEVVHDLITLVEQVVEWSRR